MASSSSGTLLLTIRNILYFLRGLRLLLNWRIVFDKLSSTYGQTKRRKALRLRSRKINGHCQLQRKEANWLAMLVDEMNSYVCQIHYAKRNVKLKLPNPVDSSDTWRWFSRTRTLRSHITFQIGQRLVDHARRKGACSLDSETFQGLSAAWEFLASVAMISSLPDMTLVISDTKLILGMGISAALLHHFTLQYPVQAPFVKTLRCYIAAILCFAAASYYLQRNTNLLQNLSISLKAYCLYVFHSQCVSTDCSSHWQSSSKRSTTSFSAIGVFQAKSIAKPLIGDYGKYTAQAVPIDGSKPNTSNTVHPLPRPLICIRNWLQGTLCDSSRIILVLVPSKQLKISMDHAPNVINRIHIKSFSRPPNRLRISSPSGAFPPVPVSSVILTCVR